MAIFMRMEVVMPKPRLYSKESLEMTRRLFKGDHPDLAVSINSMAIFYNNTGRLLKLSIYI